jgi:hypothetical protein
MPVLANGFAVWMFAETGGGMDPLQWLVGGPLYAAGVWWMFAYAGRRLDWSSRRVTTLAIIGNVVNALLWLATVLEIAAN